MKDKNNLISLPMAARMVNETTANFRHFILREETPEYIKIGRFYFFDRDDIKKWIKPHKKWGGKRKDGRNE
jgi:predicted DNA-binding transcriptional regulator AlpA